MTIPNPFVDTEGASKYQVYRPLYHSIPFLKLKDFMGRSFLSSLDVACGTGHSTEALSKISDVVIGCDASPEMLYEARKNSGINYVEARAEELPFQSERFELVNVSMGIHWFDQQRFLREACRVLVKDGYLSIDHFGFTGILFSDQTLQEKHLDFYNEFLPSPKRNRPYPSEDILNLSGFMPKKEFSYEYNQKMNAKEFCEFLMTQSNFLSQPLLLRSGLVSQLSHFYEGIFSQEIVEIPFKGRLKLFQRRLDAM